jgi:hypothetical protein
MRWKCARRCDPFAVSHASGIRFASIAGSNDRSQRPRVTAAVGPMAAFWGLAPQSRPSPTCAIYLLAALGEHLEPRASGSVLRPKAAIRPQEMKTGKPTFQLVFKRVASMLCWSPRRLGAKT